MRGGRSLNRGGYLGVRSDFSSFEWNNWDLVVIHNGFHSLSLYGGSNMALYPRSFTLLTTKEKSLGYEKKLISIQERQKHNRRKENKRKNGKA